MSTIVNVILEEAGGGCMAKNNVCAHGFVASLAFMNMIHAY